MVKVTVGVPVYNGAEHIAESLHCVLNGSHKDIKVVVSDNGSTDDTIAIVKAIAEQDPRVSLIRQDQNLGALGNFKFLLDHADTPFFMWRAHDDISDSNYIAVLLEMLDKYPQANLAVPAVTIARPHKQREKLFTAPVDETTGCAHWSGMQRMNASWIYGLFRTEYAQNIVEKTLNQYPHTWGWDYLVLLDALIGQTITGTNGTRFTQQLHGVSAGRYEYSKAELRRFVRDFYTIGGQYAACAGITGVARVWFGLLLTRFIFRKVVRWQRLI